jgi:geranylgeranyl pyrophosphate synthase
MVEVDRNLRGEIMATHDGIELMRSKLERMAKECIDDVRDIIGNPEYSSATQTIAQEMVDRYDYPEARW